jgi:hypothetical protein
MPVLRHVQLIIWAVINYVLYKSRVLDRVSHLCPSPISAHKISGLYYKHVTIVNDTSSDVNK